MSSHNCCFRFYVATEKKRRKTCAEIYAALVEAHGEDCPSQATVYRWFAKEECDPSPRNEARGRPSTTSTPENVVAVKKVVEENPRFSIRHISEELGINRETVRQILTVNLEMRKICSVWVPHTLTDHHKELRVGAAKGIIRKLNQLGETAKRVYTIEDETWVPYEPYPSRNESKTWVKRGEKGPFLPRPQMTDKKTLLMVAFTPNKKFSVEGTEKGETVDADRYIEFLKRTGDKWRTLRSDPTKLSDLVLQHDNARPHSAQKTKQFCERRSISLLWQSPYSPDLNICDRWLFDVLKKQLRSQEFEDAEEVVAAALRTLRDIPEEALWQQVEKLLQHCKNVIQSKGDYVV